MTLWRSLRRWWNAWRESRAPRPVLLLAPPVLLLPAPRVRGHCNDLALPEVICLPDARPAPVPKVSKPRRKIAGLKADILDKLDEYQVYIKRLRRHDRDAYLQYRKIGAYVLDKIIVAHVSRLEPGVVASLPSFGAVAWLSTPSIEGASERQVGIKFCYFTKLARPGPWIERANGTVYTCVVYWDDKDALTPSNKHWKINHGASAEYAVCVSGAGDVQALRMLKAETQIIHHRRGNGPRTTALVRQRWGVPHISESGEHAKLIVSLFTLMMNFWHTAAHQSMIRVTASKGDVVMPFVVDVLDAPKFFADRDIAPGRSNARKRPIFHVVRPHAHKTRKGNVLHRRMSFRGQREFKWHGYDIYITVPGLEHPDFGDATFGALQYADDEEIPADTVGLPAMADRLAATQVEDFYRG